jgi:hypothetical protein
MLFSVLKMKSITCRALSALLFTSVQFTVLNAQQKYTISGFVNEKGSGEHLPGVLVYQPGTANGVVTNAYGFYSITLPASDTMKLAFSFIGFSPVSHQLKLNRSLKLNVELVSLQNLEEVEIVGSRTEPVSQDVQMSRIDIPVDKVKDIPALLGEKDVLKVLQLMPGVQKGSEGSSGFYVRGGGPDQNLIILDDATVYNAFHLFGFFSLFNGDALKSIELTKGGFPARYGGRLSSVLDMQLKEGNKEKIRGEGGIGLISSRLTIEGPIVKGKSSFLVSGRRTYIDALVQPFLPPDQKGGYYFYDLNAKVNYVFGDKDRLFLSGYFGKDRFYGMMKQQNSKNTFGIDWGNATATARWNHLFSDRLFANTSLIFTDYKLRISSEFTEPSITYSMLYSSGIRDYAIKSSFDFIPNPRHYVRFGLHGIYHRFTPGASVIKGSFMEDNLETKSLFETFENALFIEDDWKISAKWRANGGLRLTQFIHKKEHVLNPEPRASVRYLIREDLSVKASYAMMNQYMHLLSNTGIGLPTDLWVPATSKAPYMSSQQWAAGVAKDFLKKGYDVAIEGYYKEMKNVLGYREGASFLAVGANSESVGWETNVTSGRGWSYGGELLLRKNTGKFTGWIGYTLSWTQLQFDALNFGKKFYARYDRRHDISVVGVYKLSRRITLSATWVYGTGNAITLPLTNYRANTYGLPYTSSNPTPLNQSPLYYVQDYGQQRNAYRMSPYHRMDIGVPFHKQKKRSVRTFELGVYNVYNRLNPFFYYIDNKENGEQVLMQVSLFPIIPSVSWNWKF